MSVKTISVNCPTCKNKVLMTDEFPHRPFCSERCKMIDFGDWAAEKNRIGSDTQQDDVWSEDPSNQE